MARYACARRMSRFGSHLLALVALPLLSPGCGPLDPIDRAVAVPAASDVGAHP